ncbi:MAG TPA: hypothetical protein VEB67_03265, partial [Nitrososphaerales archaeon]|nr:hypothetical protein [Nitrososphaerales archaeon]
GGVVVEPSDSGVNNAVRFGMEALGGGGFLVLPSDLPYLAASDIHSLLASRDGGADVVISPSAAFDGTNAYLFSSKDEVPLSYDDDSFWNHVEGVGAAGLKLSVSTRRGLVNDVDSVDDLRLLAKSNRRTESAKIARRALD